ncbi:Alpha-L-rhamnosidase [Penicillium malachiteum]|uniref:alpha-L-rhamnosidase n=1 Tax=Penicillium malachiteum TaxID=1324776 RepID=A0AAD6MWG9_9EURO|nr:Alpha-L-rhamnosidase [Penicillium malachiteum]
MPALFKFYIALFFWLEHLVAATLTIEDDSLRAQGLMMPTGISTKSPTLSWRLVSDERNEPQTAYQLQAFTYHDLWHYPDLWDTSKVEGDDVSVIYSGKELSSRSGVYWRVRLGETSLPLFAKSIEVSCPVAKARLYVLGLGMQSVQLNGEEVTDEVLAPGYSNFNKTLIYTTYDVSKILKRGSNVIGVELGRGMWQTETALGGRYMKFTTSPTPLVMIAQLEYTCSNGKTLTVISDDTWKTSIDGPLLESSWYGGEEYDARKEIPKWSSPEGDIHDWDSATVVEGPTGTLAGPQYPPLRVVDTIKPVKITGPVSGQYIIDFGINFAGWFALTINENNGTRIAMWPAERLTANGGPDQSTTGSPIYDAFTSAGVSQIYKPKFMYHGFRYLAVNMTDPPVLSDVEGLMIRTDAEVVGTVDTSDDLLNGIHRIIDRAIQSNIYIVMTDCPHREKLGWLEQTSYSQTTVGLAPDIAPEFVVFEGGFRDDPNWGNAIVLLLLMLYQTYGDVDLLNSTYPSMTRYVDYLSSQTDNSTLAYGLGDWIAFDTSTPLGITATFGYFEALSGMKTIAAALGKIEDYKKYADELAKLLVSFQDYFLNTQNDEYSYGSGSQASNAIALDIGAVPSAHQAQVVQNITDSIIQNGNHLAVGEIALPSLFRVLQAGGKSDILYKMMVVPTSPSYAYQILHGATSLTERWDDPTAYKPGANSQNHFMLGNADQ